MGPLHLYNRICAALALLCLLVLSGCAAPAAEPGAPETPQPHVTVLLAGTLNVSVIPAEMLGPQSCELPERNGPRT